MRAPVTIAALAGWCLASAAAPLLAQAPTPDGWVVLPVDEYRALRDRALGVAPPPPAPPVEATLTRVDYDLPVERRFGRRPRGAHDRRAARRVDARADSRGPDGARRAHRRTAGPARRGAAAARVVVARRAAWC